MDINSNSVPYGGNPTCGSGHDFEIIHYLVQPVFGVKCLYADIIYNTFSLTACMFYNIAYKQLFNNKKFLTSVLSFTARLFVSFIISIL